METFWYQSGEVGMGNIAVVNVLSETENSTGTGTRIKLKTERLRDLGQNAHGIAGASLVICTSIVNAFADSLLSASQVRFAH